MNIQNESCNNVDQVLEKKISSDACDVLNELRKSGQLTDSVIRVADGSFSVHRAVMSSCSPYFRALYTNGMRETERREILLPNVEHDMMEAIVEYAYTRRSVVTSENVERLLPAADEFHVVGLVKACCSFLDDKLTAKNAVGIRNFARRYFCSAMNAKATEYIMQNFVEISKVSEELVNLQLYEVVEIIRSDELNVKNEEVVFEAVLRWINHDGQSLRYYMFTNISQYRI